MHVHITNCIEYTCLLAAARIQKHACDCHLLNAELAHRPALARIDMLYSLIENILKCIETIKEPRGACSTSLH